MHRRGGLRRAVGPGNSQRHLGLQAANAGPPPRPDCPAGAPEPAGRARQCQRQPAWSAPPTNGGSAILGYNVYRGLSSGQENAAPTRRFDVLRRDLSLTNGTKYYFKVTAVNAVGEGQKSTEASATPEPTVPGPPSNLTAQRASSKGVTLAWSAPASNGGASITGYRLNRSTSASGRETFDVR